MSKYIATVYNMKDQTYHYFDAEKYIRVMYGRAGVYGVDDDDDDDVVNRRMKAQEKMLQLDEKDSLDTYVEEEYI